MMSTYEMVVNLFSSNTTTSSTIEVTTIQTRKVSITEADSEANAPHEAVV